MTDAEQRTYDLALLQIEALESTIRVLSMYFCSLFPDDAKRLQDGLVHERQTKQDALTVEDAKRMLAAERHRLKHPRN